MINWKGYQKMTSKNFSEIWEEYKHYVGSIINNFAVLSESDKEECVQDTAISIHKNLSKFRGDCKISSWIYAIARSRALIKVRIAKRDMEKISILYQKLKTDSGSYEIEQKLENRDLLYHINCYIKTLPKTSIKWMARRLIKCLELKNDKRHNFTKAGLKTCRHRARQAIKRHIQRISKIHYPGLDDMP